MAEDDKLLELKRYLENLNKKDKSFVDKIEPRDVLLFLGGVAVGYGIKAVADSEIFRNAGNNAKIMMRDYLDNTIKYREPSDDDVEVYIMNKDGE